MFLAAAVLTTAVLVASCASAPPSGKPEVSVQIVSARDVSGYGMDWTTNPFLAPSLLARGTPDEFVVLAITTWLPGPLSVGVDATVTNSAGDEVARMYGLQEMHDYWSNWGDQYDKPAETRLVTLDRYYIPSYPSFDAPKGKRTYYAVLIGKKPIARPSTVRATVSLGDQEPQVFTFDMPPIRKSIF